MKYTPIDMRNAYIRKKRYEERLEQLRNLMACNDVDVRRIYAPNGEYDPHVVDQLVEEWGAAYLSRCLFAAVADQWSDDLEEVEADLADWAKSLNSSGIAFDPPSYSASESGIRPLQGNAYPLWSEHVVTYLKCLFYCAVRANERPGARGSVETLRKLVCDCAEMTFSDEANARQWERLRADVFYADGLDDYGLEQRISFPRYGVAFSLFDDMYESLSGKSVAAFLDCEGTAPEEANRSKLMHEAFNLGDLWTYTSEFSRDLYWPCGFDGASLGRAFEMGYLTERDYDELRFRMSRSEERVAPSFLCDGDVEGRAERAREIEEWSSWIDGFPDKEGFIARYEDLRAAVLGMGAVLRKELKEMGSSDDEVDATMRCALLRSQAVNEDGAGSIVLALETVLSEHGIGFLLHDETFFTIYNMLRRACLRSEELVDRTK